MKPLFLAVTYRCNADCDYCYTKDFKRNFPGDMDFFTFLDTTNKWINAGGKLVSLIGGEPTTWKHVDKAITYCRLRGISVTLTTNGIRHSKSVPNNVFMSILHYFEEGKKEKVIKSLEYYSRKKASITLRYNISYEGTEEQLEEIISLSKKYGVNHIHAAPITPYKFERKLGDRIYSVVKKFLDGGIRCRLGNPVPPCVFSEEQREYLSKRAALHYKCSAGLLALVHPDGKTIQPCTELYLPKDMSILKKSFKNIPIAFEKEMNDIRKNLSPSCQACNFYLSKQCFGGCLINHQDAIRKALTKVK